MKTPIFDFVKKYAKQNITRAHMPGHKGRHGIEKYDITEIFGADVLYEENGIIAESEQNTASLFNSGATLYSAEGSTLSIKTMLGVIAELSGGKPLILAGRNAHKSFINACALLDIQAEWLYGESNSLCECKVSENALRTALGSMGKKPDALYITSPDYLGNVADIKSLSCVCREYNIPLIVDNAHGAYLRFLNDTEHPINLGAVMCADSAHKTLSVLTGGAYLHIAKGYEHLLEIAKRKMMLFASTSPSYLILRSLDKCNAYLSRKYFEKAVKATAVLKAGLIEKGYRLVGTEPLKITLDCAEYGYTGEEIASILRDRKIECEYADNRFLVLMLSPENTARDYRRIKKALCSVRPQKPLEMKLLNLEKGERVMSIRKAVLSESETVNIENAVGRICALPLVSCPPAVPIIVSGEKVTEQTVKLLKEYKIEKINVLKEV